MRRLEAAVAGVVLAILVTGLALGVATGPWLTSTLVDRVGSAEPVGLSVSQTRELAEEVRDYVTRSGAPELPARAFDRPAFDAAQISHLDDVRGVMLAARNASILSFGAFGVWLAWCLLGRRVRAAAAAARVGGGLLLGFPVIALVAGLFDFDTLFERFHSLLFVAGTWTFASNDLVIQLFPEAFWMLAAAVWGGLVVIAGVALLIASKLLERRMWHASGRDE